MGNLKTYKLFEVSDSIGSGFACNKNNEVPNGYVHLRTHNIDTNGKLNFDLLIKINDVKVQKNKATLRKGDVLFNNTNSTELVGKTALVNQDYNYAYSNHLNLIRFNKSLIEPAFGVYFLNKLWLQGYFARVCNKWIGQSGINLNILKNIELELPKISKQQKIVAKLDSIFDKTDKSIIVLEDNLKHSKALLLSVLDEEFNKLNCKYVSIGSLLHKTKNLNPILEFKNDEFTYIDITSINNSIYKIETPKTLKGKNAPSRAKKIVELGDIIFATTRPNLKNIAIVTEDYKNPIASTGFCVLRTNKNKLFNEYLFYFLTSQKVQELIVPFIKGAQYPAISDKDLLSIDIPLPKTIEEQKEIVSRIKLLTDKTNDLMKEIQIKLDNIKALKSSLLDEAFKGEL